MKLQKQFHYPGPILSCMMQKFLGTITIRHEEITVDKYHSWFNDVLSQANQVVLNSQGTRTGSYGGQGRLAEYLNECPSKYPVPHSVLAQFMRPFVEKAIRSCEEPVVTR
eukprot:Protomagalhaensia_sp_Gyna_25__3240@NODE_2949_length_806_cov_1_940026_g2464_i0_p1_GENE_NODE_2949_length_806_cov_1_940026_g2464_i0NODE_2949_length_806_cov_1_940026_g2464_i0_p1_ORF_typecomplete_len110_score9_10_NODE_2949_length_806_cov_1_940026_g2464_i0477806